MGVDTSKIALALAEHRCILVGEFRLSSGLVSPYYIDLRAVPSYPGLFDLMTDAYVLTLSELKIPFDRIAGIATAGIPLAALVAYKLGKPFLYVRKEERVHGTQRLVEGDVKAGDMVIILDDVVTTGGNLLRGIRALRERRAKVGHALVLVDREQGAKENLEAAGVKLISVLTSSEVIEHLYSKGVISREDYKRVVDYIRGVERA
jgi:orotate phosphoribosyltransferase